MTHRHNAITDTWKYRVLPGMVRYTFILVGLFAKPNLCPLTQNSGDATGANDKKWITSGIKASIKKKSKLYRKWRESDNDFDG